MLITFEGVSSSLCASMWNARKEATHQWSVLASRVNENLEAAGKSATKIIYSWYQFATV